MNNRRNFIKNTSLGLLGLKAALGKATYNQPIGDIKTFSQSKNDDQLFALVKKSLLLSKELVYLNTGSLGPSPGWLVNRISTLMNELESNPVGNNWGELGKQMEAVRQKVADFINAQKEEIILTRNTTEGINLIGSCLKLQKGDEILTTTHEHGGGENGLIYLAKNQGAVLRKMDLPMPLVDKDELIDFIKKQIRPKTKVLMLSHINTITGLKMPFPEIAEVTRPKGILLIADGAQAPGMVNVDVKKLGVDIYATSGHKWLLGPKETGFIYIRKAIQQQIKSVFTQTGITAYTASAGTRNVATIIGFGEILDWHQLIGKKKIENRCKKLAQYCRQQLTEINNLHIISPKSEELTAGIVSVILKKGESKDIFHQMREKHIIIKKLPILNALRFSTHIFNTKTEVDKMVTALKDMMR